MKKCNYYILNYEGTKWGLIDIKSLINIEIYKKVNLYDENLNFFGVGLY